MLPEFTVLSFFRRILSSPQTVIDRVERDTVRRNLRVLYFYPDVILKALDEIRASDGADVTPLGFIKNTLEASQKDADSAIAYLTSDSVVTNLKIPLPIIAQIRAATHLKGNIRGCLVSIFFNSVFQPPQAVDAAAKRALEEIKKLNTQIEAIDRALDPTPPVESVANRKSRAKSKAG